MNENELNKQKINDFASGDLQRQVQYYKRLSDEVAGYNIRIDSQISLLKRSLQQKENGFSILSALNDVFGREIEEDKLFTDTLKLINTTLKMDYSLVVWQHKNNSSIYVPKWCLGFDESQLKAISARPVDLQNIDQIGINSILVNKASPFKELIEVLRTNWRLNFFMAVPLRVSGITKGWMIAGREKEAWPFYPPIEEGDLDTLLAIKGFMEAAMANARLYKSLEQVNLKLEEANRDLEKRVADRTQDLEIRNQEISLEKKRSDDLLLNILPEETAEELKKFGYAKAKHIELVTVMFTDFVNFTKLAAYISSTQLVAELDLCFRRFDEIVTEHGLEKIKTIGDAHMSAGGISGLKGSPADVIKAGLEIRDFVTAHANEQPENLKEFFRIRIGIHSGSVVAGVVGLKKFSFDIWGDTVNMADRLQTTSVPGKVNVSEATYLLTKEEFNFEYRGKLQAKNKGEIPMYFVELKA